MNAAAKINTDLLSVRDGIRSHINSASASVLAFFGDATAESTIEVISASEAHQLITGSHNIGLSEDFAAFRIADAAAYNKAAEDLQRIKGFQKRVGDKTKAITDCFRAGEKATRDFFAPAKEFLDGAETAIKREMLAFQREQDRLRLLEQARNNEEARKTTERIQERAEKAEERGKVEVAGALQQVAATVVAAPVAPAATVAVKGISTKKAYKAKVVSLMDLLRAIVDGKAPINLVMADQSTLDKMAGALKDGFAGMYPGVELDIQEGIASRSK